MILSAVDGRSDMVAQAGDGFQRRTHNLEE
jgi:hypothetical protein